MDGTVSEVKEATGTVTITQQRYEQLLDIETRVDVVVERILHKEFMTLQDILWILGTELAIETARELDRKDKEKWEKYDKEHKEVSDNED